MSVSRAGRVAVAAGALSLLAAGCGAGVAARSDASDDLTPSAAATTPSPRGTVSATRSAPAPTRPAATASRATPTLTPPATTPPARIASPAPDGVALPTHDSTTTPRGALRATVVGHARSGCVWLADPSGRRVAALWPAGYRAVFAPLRVYDAEGRIVWREGGQRTVGGGSSTVHVDRIRPACRVGASAWWVAPLS